MKNFIEKVIEKEKNEVINNRRRLHRCAELSFCEYKTAEFLENYLKDIGLNPERVLDTGVIAFLDAKKNNTILLRADMDALMLEETGEIEFKSENSGVMHACGHDAHMAVLLSVAKILNEHKDKLNVNVLFVFQPGEETEGGALPMINTGILKKYNVVECLGLHVMNDVPSGKIMIKEGALMASPDDFSIEICGKGGHGAYPDKCNDPIEAALSVVGKINQITDKEIIKGEKQIVQVCMLNAGTTCNIIPDSALIQGTARSFNENVRKRITEVIESILKESCASFGVNYRFTFNYRYPPLINDKYVANKLKTAVNENMGDIVISWEKPVMAGDDFAYFAKEVPSVYFYLGTGNDKKGTTMPLHASNFNIDEDALTLGIGVYLSYILGSF